MALAAGTKLGAYEVTSAIGAGGMGEVYKAHDTKLGRDVAIKVLPEAFADDAERLTRFQREAKMLAALNHPNIATIYGLEHSERVHYLVMELVPGETLAEQIRKGALPLGEALRVVSQIAEALEAAHEKSIIHRDLKPANVKVTPEGKVKVLDFGLAKAFVGDAASGEDPSNSPTLSQAATMHGVILGTAAYMSPEQARGKRVDKRTDIWAFGCVLYELLAVRPAIRGETLSDTIAAVLEGEPDWQALPASTPTKIRDLLRRCLQKERDRRLRDIGDARIEIEEALATPKDAATSPAITATAPATGSRAPLLGWIAAGALLTGLGILAFVHFRGTPPVAQPVRLQIPVPDGMAIYNFQVAISPDGRRIAFGSGATDTPRRLWVRELDSLELRPLPGAEISARPGPPPFWSPDGRWVAVVVGEKLKKVEISGGFPQTICDAEILGGAWNRDGVIILGGEGGLRRCPAAGGPTAPVTVVARGETAHARPQFLPDGRHFLYNRIAHTPEKTGVFSPASPRGKFLHAWHFDRQVEICLKAIELDPHFVPVRWQLAMADSFVGASIETIRECDTALAMAPGNSFARRIAMVIRAKCGQVDEARKALTKLERNWRPDGFSSYWIAQTHTLLGEKDAGFEWLGRAPSAIAGSARATGISPAKSAIASDHFTDNKDLSM